MTSGVLFSFVWWKTSDSSNYIPKYNRYDEQSSGETWYHQQWLYRIIFITSSCAGKYKCGTALYLLTMLAQWTGKIIYHFTKCAGHGKCRCIAEGGCHKTFCDTAFDKFVTVPEQQVDGKRWAPLHKVKRGSIISLASTVFNILQDEDYV
jgi:hypothetical protein